MSTSTGRNQDIDVFRWAIEFLLRQLQTPSHIMTKILTNSTVPLSDTNPRFRKILLLCELDTEIEDGSVSEKTLDSLEKIEEIDREEGGLILDSMKKAYCAVAVECTVKYLLGNLQRARKGKFLGAVKRVWEERVGRLEREGMSELVTDELMKCWEDMGFAVWDDGVAKRWVKRNTRNEAVEMVKVYLGEAVAISGPVFIDMLARTGVRGRGGGEIGGVVVNGDGGEVNEAVDRSRVGGGGENGGVEVNEAAERRREGGDGENLGVEMNEVVESREGGCDQNIAMEVDVGGCLGLADRNLKLGPADQPVENGRDGEKWFMRVNVGGGSVCTDVDAGKGCSRLVDSNLELGPADKPAKEGREIQKNNMLRRHKHVAPIKRSKGPVKIINTEIAEGDPSSSLVEMVSTDKVNRVQEALRASSKELLARVKDPLPDALQLAGNVIAQMARKLYNQGTSAETQSEEGVDAVISELARKILNPDPSVKNQKGKDAGSSSPSASQTVVSSAKKQSGNDTDACNHSANPIVEPSAENLNLMDADAANPSTNQTALPLVKNDEGKGVHDPNLSASLSKQDNAAIASCSHPNNVPKPRLMERNATARTFEWDDSIADSSEGTGDQMKRFHLDRAKRKAVSPLKKYELARVSKRRKPKKWSLEEEDALREAVKKYGQGNWKLIWSSNRDAFQERTEVDLKDKWRNMIRYGCC